MRLKPDDKQKLVEKIRSGAAKAFRAHGYDAVSLDAVMKQSGLTRGAFYAHYKSKQALFADVVRHEHPLLRMLEQRRGDDAKTLYREMCAIFDGYLGPDDLEEVFAGCSFASLIGDVVRAGAEVKAGFDHAVLDTCTEMARGQRHPANDYLPALLLATAAVRNAQASADSQLRYDTLRNAHLAFRALLPTPTEDLA